MEPIYKKNIYNENFQSIAKKDGKNQGCYKKKNLLTLDNF